VTIIQSEYGRKGTLMRVAVAHHTLNIPGGAERLCLTTIEALQNRGHDVTLISVEKTDWCAVKKKFGDIVLPAREVYAMTARASAKLSSVPIAATYFSAYIGELLWSKCRNRYDVVLNTFGDIVNSIADLTYIHFPLRAAAKLSQIPAFSERQLWQIAHPFYDMVARAMDQIYPGALLTNSRFMQGIIREVIHREARVVYPPVDVARFKTRAAPAGSDRQNMVVVVASYPPKRHIDQVPRIAERTKFARFVIMGKADEYSGPTLKTLRELVRECKVEDKVSLMQNVPFASLASALGTAKVYLHVMPNDHFGISAVEAMASGCVPVVHRSGGPWWDILEGMEGEYGFSYLTPGEAAQAIDSLMTDDEMRLEIALRAQRRAKEFDRTVFMRTISEEVERLAR